MKGHYERIHNIFFNFSPFSATILPNNLCYFNSFHSNFLKPAVTESTVVRSIAASVATKVISSWSSLNVGSHGPGDVLRLDLSIGRILHCGELDGFSLLLYQTKGEERQIPIH